MALRFQDKDDEVERFDFDALATEVGRELLGGVVLFVVVAVIMGVIAWVSGESLHTYEQDTAFAAAFFFGLVWVVIPLHVSRIRAKSINGKVSEIEKAVTAAKEVRAELVERLNVIEGKLDTMRRDIESHIEHTR